MTSLFGIPFTLIGSAFGALTGWLTKKSAMEAELRAAERKHQIDAMTAVATANTSAVEDEIKLLEAKAKYETETSAADPHRSIARRVIAYAMVASIAVIIPGIVLFGDISWFQMISKTTTTSFLGLLNDTKTTLSVVTAKGLPMIWLDGMLTLVATITSFYFGGSAAKFSNPYTKK